MHGMKTLQCAACQAAFSNCIGHKSVYTVPETMPLRLSKSFSAWRALRQAWRMQNHKSWQLHMHVHPKGKSAPMLRAQPFAAFRALHASNAGCTATCCRLASPFRQAGSFLKATLEIPGSCRGFPVEQYKQDRLGLVLAFWALGLHLGRPLISQTDCKADGTVFGAVLNHVTDGRFVKGQQSQSLIPALGFCACLGILCMFGEFVHV